MGGAIMNLKKYLKKADKLDLATYKLALECQINDTQDTINFLVKQIKNIELRENKKNKMQWPIIKTIKAVQ